MPIELALLGNEFFTNIVLPFVLIFTVIFAMLEKTEILGKKKEIHAIISLIISLIAVGVPAAIGTLQKFIPIIAVILIILFAWMLVFGFAGTRVQVEWSKGLRTFFMVALGVVLLTVIVWAVGSTTGFLEKINLDKVLSAQITQTVLFVGAIVAVIAIVVGGDDKHKKED